MAQIPDPFTVLQAIHATIAGVSLAEPRFPTRINNADLPLVETEPGPGGWAKAEVGAQRGYAQIQRTMTVKVHVKPVSQGEGQTEGFLACFPLMVQFGARYLNDITLGGTVNKVDLISDSGAVVFTSNTGQEHWGFIFKLRLTQIFSALDTSLPVVPAIAHAHVNGTLQTNVPPPNP